MSLVLAQIHAHTQENLKFFGFFVTKHGVGFGFGDFIAIFSA